MIMKYFNILAILKSNLWYKFVSYIYVIFCIYRYPKDVKCFLSNCRQLSINISFMFWLIFWKVINFVLTLFCGYSQSPSPLILVDSWLFSPSLSFHFCFLYYKDDHMRDPPNLAVFTVSSHESNSCHSNSFKNYCKPTSWWYSG